MHVGQDVLDPDGEKALGEDVGDLLKSLCGDPPSVVGTWCHIIPMRKVLLQWPTKKKQKKSLTIQPDQLNQLIVMKSLGQRIKELRLEADLSLKGLGEKIGGKSAAFLSDIELGNRFPSDEVLEKLAEELGTTVEDLRQHDQRPPTKEIQELISLDANYGMAFRTLVKRVKNGQISPSDVLKRFPEGEKK